MDKYILAFLKCKGVGNVKLLKYLKKYKFNIVNILKNKNEIIDSNDLLYFDNFVKKSEEEILNNLNKGIKIISIFNNKYPVKLYETKDPILYLYYQGNISLLFNTSIAVIGSRKIEDIDKKLTVRLAEYISKNNITVVSGLALGSDTYAHIGSCKEKGHTIAVLPSGLDIITPSSNKKLADEILNNNGLLISEYSVGTVPTKYTYVKRDRIQAALADAIMIVKASEKSGTMHAVKLAQELNKYVTQYKTNNNALIENTFETKEDIIKVLEKAQKMKYDTKKNNMYEQKSLF